MPVTITDIAKRANVSKTIVSRVINNRKGVSSQTREEVWRIVRELGYRANGLARSLSMCKTDTLGVILNNLCTQLLFDMIGGIEDVGLEEGYNVLFCSGKNDLDVKSRYIDFFAAGRADGIIIYGSAYSDDDLIAGLYKSEYPLVLIENYFDTLDVYSVYIDNYTGSYKAVKYLIGLGHTGIAHILGNPRTKAGTDRLQGCLSALRDGGIVPREAWFVESSFSRDSGYQAMQQILCGEHIPTAVFCGSDTQAYGALRAIYEHRLRVPEDISVVGFDDDPPSLDEIGTYPRLTTVAQPMYAIGRAAANLLLRAIREPAKSGVTVKVDTELRVRESCAPPRGRG